MTDGDAHEVHPNQERVHVPNTGMPNPADFNCEWCQHDEPAAYAIQITHGAKRMPTQMYIYACPKHKLTAETAAVR